MNLHPHLSTAVRWTLALYSRELGREREERERDQTHGQIKTHKLYALDQTCYTIPTSDHCAIASYSCFNF
jgi:hypothetical protein